MPKTTKSTETSESDTTKKRGAPKKENPLSIQVAVRLTPEAAAAYHAEAARLTEKTGVAWKISGFLRFAAEQMLGKHLP